MYILHIIPKEFLIFFFQAADQKTKGKFTLFWGDTFYDSTKVYDDDFFFLNRWLKTKNLTLPLNLLFTIPCEIPHL